LSNKRIAVLLPALIVVLAVSVFVGTVYSGHGMASKVSWTFWDGAFVHYNPDKNSCDWPNYVASPYICPVTDNYANGGISHIISVQVRCSDGSHPLDGAEVSDAGGAYYNYWWGYLPYKNGWANEVHFQGGGNNLNSIPATWVTTINQNGNDAATAKQAGCGHSLP
jgi:hypothetical protein